MDNSKVKEAIEVVRDILIQYGWVNYGKGDNRKVIEAINTLITLASQHLNEVEVDVGWKELCKKKFGTNFNEVVHALLGRVKAPCQHEWEECLGVYRKCKVCFELQRTDTSLDEPDNIPRPKMCIHNRPVEMCPHCIGMGIDKPEKP